MKAWTDYPFTELGDTPRKKAPLRECNVIAYDGNKYCVVEFEGQKLEVKSGYLYPDKPTQEQLDSFGGPPCLTSGHLHDLYMEWEEY